MSSKRKGPTPKRQWVRMAPARPLDPELFARTNPGATIWMNDRYTVIVAPQSDDGMDGAVWLSIRRNDRKAARDWRDFQQIKNDICGAEREGVELYPAESRLVDTANQYHVWVMPAGMTLPIGFNEGRVLADDGDSIEVNGETMTMDDALAGWGAPEAAVSKAKQRARS